MLRKVTWRSGARQRSSASLSMHLMGPWTGKGKISTCGEAELCSIELGFGIFCEIWFKTQIETCPVRLRDF